jgi:hypothetical protein
LPAAFVVAETVAVPVVLEIATSPRELIGAALVIPVEELSRTVPALIVPVPVVFTVEDALVIETSWAAVIVEVVLLVKVALAPVLVRVMLPEADVRFAF